jgi:hypothetical protein
LGKNGLGVGLLLAAPAHALPCWRCCARWNSSVVVGHKLLWQLIRRHKSVLFGRISSNNASSTAVPIAKRNMSSKLLKKQLRSFVNQEKIDSTPSRKVLPSKVISGNFKVSKDGRKKQRQMLQLQSKSSSYTQQRLAIESDNMKHNLFVFNRSNQPTPHQLEVAQLLLPKKVRSR